MSAKVIFLYIIAKACKKIIQIRGCLNVAQQVIKNIHIHYKKNRKNLYS